MTQAIKKTAAPTEVLETEPKAIVSQEKEIIKSVFPFHMKLLNLGLIIE